MLPCVFSAENEPKLNHTVLQPTSSRRLHGEFWHSSKASPLPLTCPSERSAAWQQLPATTFAPPVQIMPSVLLEMSCLDPTRLHTHAATSLQRHLHRPTRLQAVTNPSPPSTRNFGKLRHMCSINCFFCCGDEADTRSSCVAILRRAPDPSAFDTW